MGVDIFFVISGYLITQMIARDRQEFSFKTFYIRRFFRLFPALIVTLAACLAVGWRLLGPEDYADLGQSALAAAFGVSNIYFLTTIDYFNASGLSHPLLHTWSLGAEEQFYLVWPALLVLAWRWGIGLTLLASGLAVCSLAAVIALQPGFPDHVFYLMPFRIFEFAIGALILPVEARGALSRSASGFGLLGMALIAAPLAFVDTQTAWPSLWTLLPVAGTALLMLAGRDGIWHTFLSNPAFRFLGRISYSLYLVHWPVITFYRSNMIGEPSSMELVLLGVASLAAGTLLYMLVESPFRELGRSLTAAGQLAGEVARRPMILSPHAASVAAAAFGTATIAGAATIAATNGFPSRLNDERVQQALQELSFAGDLCSSKQARCIFGDRHAKHDVYLIGDSHALNLVFGLDRLFREAGIRGIAFYDHGCLFAFETTRFRKGAPDKRCRDNVASAYEFLAANRSPVIIAGNYAGYQTTIGEASAAAPSRMSPSEYYDWLQQKLEASLTKLSAGARTIIVVNQTYSTGINLPKCLSASAARGEAESASGACLPLSLAQAQAQSEAADRMVERLKAAAPSIVTVDPKLQFCSSEKCLTADEHGLYFRDSDHLTNAGSDFLIQSIREVLLAALAPR